MLVYFLGDLQSAQSGQAGGLAVASALVTLGNTKRHDHEIIEPKIKRKQSQHPDSI